MLRHFKSNYRTAIGIDINPAYVAAVEVSKIEKESYISCYSIEPLPQGLIQDVQILNPASVVHHLKAIFSNHSLSSLNIALAIPDSLIVNKTIQVSSRLTLLEIEELAAIEMNSFFENEYSLVAFDESMSAGWNIDFNVDRSNTELFEVSILATKATDLTPRLHVATEAGLTVDLVDIESYAKERAEQEFNLLSQRGLDSANDIKIVSGANQHNKSLMLAWGLALRYLETTRQLSNGPS